MKVLVDSSVWIDYFRDGGKSELLDHLIDENLIAVNKLILAELIRALKLRRERKLIELLFLVEDLDLKIDWAEIIEYQYRCLINGANGIGIPDLIIAQNAIQNGCDIYTLDSDFERLKTAVGLKLVEV